MSTESLTVAILKDERTPLIARRPSDKNMGLSKTKREIIFGISWILLVIGIVMGIFWIPIFNTILQRELVLTPTSKSYKMWKETPIPMYLSIYLFNWTNADDFMTPNSKPNFVEMGPYVFREVDTKVNQVWNNNDTVTFQQRRVWHFDESRSNGSLNDQVTNLNPVAASVAYLVKNRGLAVRLLINGLLKELNEMRTVTKSVRELLFDGYNDRILELAHTLNMSRIFPSSKFGWFYGRNNSETYDGTFNMLTGAEDRKLIGIIREWNYLNKSAMFPDECSTINGSLGDIWPALTFNDSVSVFVPDICTALHLDYDSSVVFEGIRGKRYISTEKMLDNGTNVPSRACYYQKDEFLPSGLLNVSTCKFGAPAFISLPHFYLADASYRDAIDGMRPEKAKHEFSVSVHPELGMPLQVNARLQLNMQIQHVRNIEIFNNIPTMYIPILWFRQEANLTSPYTGEIKFILILPLLGHVTFYGIAGIGALLFFIGIGIIIRARRKADDAQKLIAKPDASTSDRTIG